MSDPNHCHKYDQYLRGDGPVGRPLIRLQVGSATEDDSSGVSISRGQWQHDVGSASRVGPDGVWDLADAVLDVLLVIEDLSIPVGLDEQVSRRKQESD